MAIRRAGVPGTGTENWQTVAGISLCDFCLCTLYRIVLCGGGDESDYSSCRSKATDVICSMYMAEDTEEIRKKRFVDLIKEDI